MLQEKATMRGKDVWWPFYLGLLQNILPIVPSHPQIGCFPGALRHAMQLVELPVIVIRPLCT